MYKVVVAFNDLKDNGYRYEVGDKYPRKGKKPTKKRTEELASDKNKRGKILIVKEDQKDAGKSSKRTK